MSERLALVGPTFPPFQGEGNCLNPGSSKAQLWRGPMKIGILEAGDIVPEASDPHAEYGPMFHDFLTAVDPSITTEAYAIYKGVFPQSPTAADGWIISGSRHGVYEDHDWIEPAEAFVRASVEARVPIVGICFGHQLIAQALGGVVEKSKKGWGTGVNRYALQSGNHFVPELGETSVRALHQDQVIVQPPGSTVFASSEFCEFAGLYYGPEARPDAITLQPHPEFSADYLEAVLKVRRGAAIPEDRADAGLQSLSKTVDNTHWARSIVQYFQAASA